MESVKLLKDGDRLLIVVDHVTEKTQAMAQKFMSEYTNEQLGINPIKTVLPEDRSERPIDMTEPTNTEQTPIGTVKQEETTDLLVPEGKYKGLKVKAAISKGGDTGLNEIIKTAAKVKGTPYADLVTKEVGLYMKHRFEGIDAQVYAKKFARKEDVMMFFKIFGCVIGHEAKQMLEQYGYSDIKSFIEAMPISELQSSIYALVEDGIQKKF